MKRRTPLIVLAALSGALTLSIVIAQRPERDVPAETEAAGTATVRGRVVRADGGEPLRGARVLLPGPTADAHQTDVVSVTTDEQGRFEITGIAAGSFKLVAERTGFVTGQYGQRRPLDAGRVIQVAAGETLEGLDIALRKGAAIAGTIRDSAGEPVTDGIVQLIRARFVQGHRQLFADVVDADRTDERGHFRLHSIPEGSYYVRAGAPTTPRGKVGLPVGFATRNSVPLEDTGMFTAFYPGVDTVEAAERLDVKQGVEIGGLVIVMPPQPPPPRLATISGTVLDLDRTPQRRQVILGRRSAQGLISFAPIQPNADGSFSFTGRAPGTYTLGFVATDIGANGESSTDHAMADRMKIVLDGVDRHLTLTPRRSAVARGRILFDGGPRPQNVRPGRAMIGIADVDTDMIVLGNNVSDRVRVNADGTFSVEFVVGQRRLNVTPPSGWVVESVRLGDRDMTAGVFDFDTGDIDGIEVRLTSKVTDVSGTLKDANRAAVTDGTIVLFPDDPAKWNPGSRFLAAVRLGRDVQFRHRGLPPGEYLAVALDYLEEGEETNPETLERLRRLGTRVTLKEDEPLTIELTVRTLPPAR